MSIRYNGNIVTSKDRKRLSQIERFNRAESVIIQEYRAFSMLVHIGFKKITYATEIHETNGTYFGISKNRALKIGQALTNNLEYFGLTLTTTEENAFIILSDEIGDGVVIDEVCLSYKSALNLEDRPIGGSRKMLCLKKGTNV